MSSAADEKAWYCVKAQTKREHVAASRLRELEGIDVFCPRLRYRKATRRGKVWWVEALFPGYVLARFSLSDMERMVVYSQGVRGLVRFGDKVPTVPDGFVERLQSELAEQADAEFGEETLTVRPQIEAGEEVEIASGPLGGFRGEVVSILPSRDRVRVLLDFLGQPQVVDVDLFSLLLPRKPLP